MSPRAVIRRCALGGAVAVLVGVAGPAASHPGGGPASPPASHPGGPDALDRLPVCPPAPASTRPPDTPPVPDAPGACRAAPARVLESAAPRRPGARTGHGGRPKGGRPEWGRAIAGYQHLGAMSTDEWAGVSGRITVRDATVRPGTYDFVATRFMAKRYTGGDEVAWLEVGWAETGWSGEGRQRIYTFDTNGRVWRFYDEYALRDGDRIWLDLRTDADELWQAWLWWGDRWHLLSSERLPLGGTAQVEQYVEVHVDRQRPARIAVPAVDVDNVQLLGAAGTTRYWGTDVGTATRDGGRPGAGLCVQWTNRYDTWSAGDCR